MSIVNESLVFGNILFRNIFSIESRTETQNNHFITALGTLVNGTMNGFGIGRREMQEDRIL